MTLEELRTVYTLMDLVHYNEMCDVMDEVEKVKHDHRP